MDNENDEIIKDYLLKIMDSTKRDFVVISPALKIKAANDNAVKTLGADFTGKSCYQLLFNRSAPCNSCPANRIKEGEESMPNDQEDDSFILERPNCYPIFSGETIDSLVMFDFDLSRISKLKEDLERSNSFLQNIILSAVDSVIAADMKGNIIIFNDEAAKLIGYEVDEALNNLNVRKIYPDDGARDVMSKLRNEEYGGKGKLKAYHVELLGKNGELIPISLYASIIYEGKREIASIGFFHDLRERLRMQKELEKTQIQLLQAEKMASLGKLAAGVAHQLNNPLGGITLYSKLILEEYDLVEGAREDLQRILKDAERCRDTVKELLEFARQSRYFMQPHDINEAISRTMFLLESHSLFQNIKIEKDLSTSLPAITTDIQQLNHLFMNIILNAAEAMDGKGELSVKSYMKADGKWICIEISDTGPGIPEDILPHIFEPFFTTKEEGMGTGLGLSLVYRIVETHGGNITARSKPGEGTTFIIEFPLDNPDIGEKENEK